MLLRQPRWIGIGGNGSIAARSASRRFTGATRIVRTTRAFALVSQSVNWASKSAGDVNDRPGMNDVSNQPLRRSTTPFDSGSRGGSSTSLVARVPMNAATPTAGRCALPMPVSLSQISRRGTRPSCWISSHDASSRSSVVRVGIIRATMNLECAAVITSTGSNFAVPSSSGIFFGGNQRSHCAASPGSHVNRSAGSIGRNSGLSRFTPARNQVIDPDQPTRSASTVAGMSGVSFNSTRTRGSNATNDDSVGVRSYRGGDSDRTAFNTVVLEIPNRSAIRAFGTPSAASRRINAQSSKVITLQSSSVHFSPPKLTSFRTPSTDR